MRIDKDVNGTALPPSFASVLAFTKYSLRPSHHYLKTRIPSSHFGKKRQQTVLRFGQDRVTLTARTQTLRIHRDFFTPGFPTVAGSPNGYSAIASGLLHITTGDIEAKELSALCSQTDANRTRISQS